MLDANQSCEKAAVCKNIKQEQRITQSNEQLVTEQHHQAEEKKKNAWKNVQKIGMQKSIKFLHEKEMECNKVDVLCIATI